MITQAQTQPASSKLLTFEGVIDTITHVNQEAGYGVLKLRVDQATYGHFPCVSNNGRVTLTGMISHIGIGEKVSVTGELVHNRKYGPQISVQEIRLMEPKTLREIEHYLAKQVHQIGPKYAKLIVDRFGTDTIRIIDTEPKRLLEIKGIGRERYQGLMETWEKQRKYRELLLFTTNIGLSSKEFEAIYKKWGSDLVERVKENPYRLAREIWGIGFQKADAVARHLGIQEMSELRVRAAMDHLLGEAVTAGHCFLYASELVSAATKFLNHPGIPEAAVAECLEHALATNFFRCQFGNRIYMPEYAEAEEKAVYHLSRLLYGRGPEVMSHEEVKAGIIEAAAQAVNIKLAPQQCKAVYTTLTSKVSVITGGPGTGKTTITKAVVAGFERSGIDITLLAPTGRAAKRMSEVIGRPAQTMHRLIWALAGAKRPLRDPNDSDKLVTGVVIIDEFSMVDIKLFPWLLKWLDDSAILVIVGDKDQLPSVGAGAVLRDLLENGTIPCTELTEIFRQAQGSAIIVNAHKINHGIMPVWDFFGKNHVTPIHSNMWVAMIEDADEQANAALWCAENICLDRGWDPRKDCMVLAPMKNGAAGVISLNMKLQTILNPNPPLKVDRGGGVVWGVGDKVMQTKNIYDLGVSNGDLGIIGDIKLTNSGQLDELVVGFDDHVVTYTEPEQWNTVRLSYASTIHKVQGSEFPMVVICMHRSHWIMLQRNLLYTAVTRGRELVVLITSGEAVSRAIGNNVVSKRNTSLTERLAALRER